MKLYLINDVACPFCGSGVGVRCRVTHRRRDGVEPPAPSVRATPHEARRLQFRIEKATEPVRPGA